MLNRIQSIYGVKIAFIAFGVKLRCLKKGSQEAFREFFSK